MEFPFSTSESCICISIFCILLKFSPESFKMSNNAQVTSPGANAASQVLKWVTELDVSKVPQYTSAAQQFDFWATHTINTLLDVFQSNICSLIYKENVIRIFKPISLRTEFRSHFIAFCLSKVTPEFKEEFGQSQWVPGMVQRVAARQQSTLDVAQICGVYALEAIAVNTVWDLMERHQHAIVTPGQASQVKQQLQTVPIPAPGLATTTVKKVSWANYGGSTAGHLDTR